MRILVLSVSAWFCIFFLMPASARDTIAFLQFSDSTGRTQLVYQMAVPNEEVCNALNENHWRGTKGSCPDCKKDHAGCMSELPSSYIGIATNYIIIFPYVSSENDRIIFVGMPIDEAITMCQTVAQGYREKINRPAKCILPN